MEKVRRFVVGIAFVITCVICVGAFGAALTAVIDFLTFFYRFAIAGFDFTTAKVITDIETRSTLGEIMSRILMSALILGVPIGLIGLVKAMRGDNPFRNKNWNAN